MRKGYHQEQPLYSLLKKHVPFSWGSEQDDALSLLKTKMANPILMHHFQPVIPCKIEVDACGYAIGGILLQNDKPVALCHKLLRGNERNWDTCYILFNQKVPLLY